MGSGLASFLRFLASGAKSSNLLLSKGPEKCPQTSELIICAHEPLLSTMVDLKQQKIGNSSLKPRDHHKIENHN